MANIHLVIQQIYIELFLHALCCAVLSPEAYHGV